MRGARDFAPSLVRSASNAKILVVHQCDPELRIAWRFCFRFPPIAKHVVDPDLLVWC